MPFSSWRGIVGIIKPTLRPGSLEDLIRLLPRGIGVIPLLNNIREGTEQEFRAALDIYETKVAELAEAGVDVIHPAGAPPFMVLGYAGERDKMAEWEKRYGVPIFTNGMNQVAALRALGAKSFVGVSYFPGKINEMFARYFTEAGFKVLEMAGMDVSFDKVQELSSLEVYRFIRTAVLKHEKFDAIYMLGSGWPTLDIIEMLERDFSVPVVQHIAAQSWEIQKRLCVRQPITGYGRLLAEMP